MTRLPSSTTSPPSTGDPTPATSDPIVGIATGDSSDPADPAIGPGSAPTGDSSVHATANPTPVDGPHVRFQRAHMPPSPAPHADSSRFHSGNSVNHVTPGPDRVRRPPPLSTSDYSPRDPMLGGTFRTGDSAQFRKIISPRVGDREQYAQDRQISRFDITGLATPAYHGGLDGVDDLTIPFLHECGYNSFTPEAPEDILLCYRDIQLVH